MKLSLSRFWSLNKYIRDIELYVNYSCTTVNSLLFVFLLYYANTLTTHAKQNTLKSNATRHTQEKIEWI